MEEQQKHLIFSLGVFLAVFLALLLSGALLRGSDMLSANGDREAFRAVFLTNGQVYFGNLTKSTKEIIVLERVFYPRAKRDLAPDSPTVTDTELVKLGTELHTPEDRMEIMKSQILFIETLKADGKVANAIQQYEKK